MIGWPGRLCHNHLVQRCCDRLARQAVVDHNHLYRDVVIGWPGSVVTMHVFFQIRKSSKRETITGTLFPKNVGEEYLGRK